MNEELKEVLALYGLLPESTGIVARPPITKAQRRVVARMKKRYAIELANAKAARIDALNLTRGVARPPIIAELLDEGHVAPALLLTFNDEQLVLLWALRDLVLDRERSDQHGRGRGSTGRQTVGNEPNADSE
jgi:hypothetical protein